jgi:hypothetical protein
MSLSSSASRAGVGHPPLQRTLVSGITAAGVYKTCLQRQYVGAHEATSDR